MSTWSKDTKVQGIEKCLVLTLCESCTMKTLCNLDYEHCESKNQDRIPETTFHMTGAQKFLFKWLNLIARFFSSLTPSFIWQTLIEGLLYAMPCIWCQSQSYTTNLLFARFHIKFHKMGRREKENPHTYMADRWHQAWALPREVAQCRRVAECRRDKIATNESP